MSEETIRCPCGTVVEKPDEFKVLFLRKEKDELDILCGNDSCYLREVGYIQFKREGGRAKFEKATFYPPFVTWNHSQMGREKADRLLKSYLKKLVKESVHWDRISELVAKQIQREKELETERAEEAIGEDLTA